MLLELLQYDRISLSYGPWFIDIFDAHQPFALMSFSVKIGTERGY